MKIVTWKKTVGYTFTVLFENGTTGAEYIAINDKTKRPYYEAWSKKQAIAAGEKFRRAKGDHWEHGNIRYRKYVPETGERLELFALRHFTA